MRKPDYERNTLRILRGQKAERATLFEIFLNPEFYERLAGRKAKDGSRVEQLKLVVDAMASAGYDYATTYASDFTFTRARQSQLKTISLNDKPPITDWQSFEAYDWGDPRLHDVSSLEKIGGYLPEGMKLMVMGPGGVLENVIALMGYDSLCLMLYDDPQLVRAVSDRVGELLVSYYQGIVSYDSVGFLCSNDDWGFSTQTFLSPEDMRAYIFPWHQRIAEVAHKASKPCILHSWGILNRSLRM